MILGSRPAAIAVGGVVFLCNAGLNRAVLNREVLNKAGWGPTAACPQEKFLAVHVRSQYDVVHQP